MLGMIARRPARVGIGRVGVVLGCVACVLGWFAACASGETAAAGWEATSTAFPSSLAPGATGTIEIQPLNIGAANSVGEVTIVDTLPAGVTATAAGTLKSFSTPGSPATFEPGWICGIEAGADANSVVRCHNSPVELPTITGGAGTWTGNEAAAAIGIGVGREPRVGIAVSVAADAPVGKVSNVVEVSGGGAKEAVTTSDPIVVGTAPLPFGLSRWDVWFSNADGTLDTRAGSVPYSATFSLHLNTFYAGEGEFVGVGVNARDFVTELPAGFIGNPDALPKCTRQHFDEGNCAKNTEVGFVMAETATNIDLMLSVYNMVAPPGVAAEFAFAYEQINVFLEAGVQTGSDYHVIVRVNNAAQRELTGATVTLWGVPGDPSHNVWRRGSEGGCGKPELEPGGECYLGAHPALGPFLRLPTSCSTPRSTSQSINWWTDPSVTSELSFLTPGVGGAPEAFGGCGALPFAPSIESRASSVQADSPTGLHFDLHQPQPEVVGAVESGGVTVGAEPGLHEADLKDATVKFPVGLVIDPSSADGLQACSEQQIGFTGFKELNTATEPGVQTAQFTPGPAECPNAAKLGTVEVDTPLLNHPLPGGIYLARQTENPFGSLLALYIAVYDPISGIVVKLPGSLEANAQTGQLTTSVLQSPQLPFNDFKINLFEGSRAPLTTPATCGSYVTSSLLVPWSALEGQSVSPTDAFEVSEAAGGGTCAATPGQEPNRPLFTSGTFTPIAAQYSPFTLHLGREDGSQPLRGVSVTLPEGLLGKLAGIERCPQADIEAAEHRGGLGQGKLELEDPSCPVGSELGIAHVGTGSGAPLYVDGKAYLAGPYKGAPFSIVVVTPAVSGPFDLGVVVVRNALFIDPSTAQVTVHSDPFPSMLYGIPLDIRGVTVEVTRPGFTLNPTSCEKTHVTGTVVGESSQVNVTSPFQVGGCNGLPFKPVFTASTAGKASRIDGESLVVRVQAGPGEANLAKVDVELPKQLPARLPTLQKACTETQFNANPAGCPPASDVATATVHTPLLASPLTGPVYFVSHGGAEFPNLVMVLQAEGIEIDLVGSTDIKGPYTYSRFNAIPDAPLTSFELNAPQGRDSILGAALPPSSHENMCGQTLYMPTTLTGQNGVVVQQNTKFAVTGCPASGFSPKKTVRTKTRAQKLAAALRACRGKYRGRGRRAKRRACERQAQRRYGLAAKSKKPKKE